MLEISNIGVLTAFVAGILSFLSPCVLPLVPGYVSYVAGRKPAVVAADTAFAPSLPAMGLSLCFVLGFSTVFIAFGASATALGQMLLSYRVELNLVGGAIVILFGLFLTGLLRPSWMMREARFHSDMPTGRAASAYVLGLAFAFGWTPCIGPILGAILTVGAASATVGQGIALLAIYSLGLGIPFLLAALFTDGLARRLKAMRRAGRMLQFAAGGIMVAMGLAMITGQLSVFSFWLLENFPIFTRIG
ncbi:cytochrome c biogenesis protein CcdA [Mesorhizobium sp.]|uniref:cytochrome c biogenesis CcdA family protein n=1 Tax=Mesorhizobium sp. TaxID=1871066 RepID=UPI000FE84DC9|nr:cytochrome c biogenesis protein CcdA [Mesorhizobium sp.]RWK65782.1 MAG: cytochrome c biogenesis protein CcdA [Mesorhizobium sp.]RWM52988.1 MAG: cytochrome c biogenesis protein CcdA [Mesorhizobium sp.]RWM60632.1 MAG: cytochrome c biogenesis protein CcdA [Mesorhizobium sp.]RWM62173.1 MAG: cytochrome c biogenesis protein CcdA [Mesorhizobium sp.]RWN04831.1 MAG: cytochrome c biogenesis protein CcdA [Mesorhizobium sp.]